MKINRPHKGAVRSTFKTSSRVGKAKPRTRLTAGKHPVSVTRVNPLAQQVASELAGGDLSRLSINSDGSVTVNNRPRKGGPRV